jgi:acyl-CoA synthetase (NDP forming)
VLREVGCPYFDSAEDLLAALRGFFDYHRMVAESEDAAERPADLPSTTPALDDLSGLVAAYGIPVPRTAVCATLENAIAAAAALGFPLVLKGLVAGVTHKTDLGLVKTGLHDVAAVDAAWRDVAAAVSAHDLGDSFEGVLLQEQVAPGLELIASIRHDPQFGPFVLVGAGGTLVELLRDVASAPAPLSNTDARRLLRSLRCAPLLDGWRGAAPCDVAAVVDAVVRLSWLAVDLGPRLIDLEINPLIAGKVGAGVRAVDLRATWANEGD